jgi:hypothetical protein
MKLIVAIIALLLFALADPRHSADRLDAQRHRLGGAFIPHFFYKSLICNDRK